jgi:nicotinamidase-related amidase
MNSISTIFDWAQQTHDSGLPEVGTSALVVLSEEDTAAGGAANGGLAALLAAARRARVFTLFVDMSNGQAGPQWPLGLAPEPSAHEFIVRAAQTGLFGASAFNLLLRSNGIETLVVTGASADLTLMGLARDARARGLQVRAAVEPMACHRVAACWLAQPEGSRSWQPEVKQAHWLRSLEQRVAPAHTALVLIDVQNDFVSAGGATGRREPMPLVDAAAARIPVLLDSARAAGCTVVHVQAEYGQHVRGVGSPYRFPSSKTREGAVWSLSATEIDEDQQFPPTEVEVCLPRSWGSELIAEVRPLPGELRVTKHRFSAFIDTPLEVMLRSRGIRTVIFAGVTTNCCIESSVRDASMLDFHVVVAEDAVGTKNSVMALHDASLEQMRTYFALVEPVARIAQALRSHAAEEVSA